MKWLMKKTKTINGVVFYEEKAKEEKPLEMVGFMIVGGDGDLTLSWSLFDCHFRLHCLSWDVSSTAISNRQQPRTHYKTWAFAAFFSFLLLLHFSTVCGQLDTVLLLSSSTQQDPRQSRASIPFATVQNSTRPNVVSKSQKQGKPHLSLVISLKRCLLASLSNFQYFPLPSLHLTRDAHTNKYFTCKLLWVFFVLFLFFIFYWFWCIYKPWMILGLVGTAPHCLPRFWCIYKPWFWCLRR